MRPVISSKKHIVQTSQSTVAQAAKVTTVLAVSIEGAPSTPTQLKEGALVKACYVELWVSMDSASVVGSYTVVLEKVPGVGGTISAGDMAALHDYDNKKNIVIPPFPLVIVMVILTPIELIRSSNTWIASKTNCRSGSESVYIVIELPSLTDESRSLRYEFP